jgi:uncharacterized protein
MHSSFLLHPPVARFFLLFFAALIGGFINSIAGGGGFIAFPALLKSGLLPIQANATTTVALWPGQFTSIAGYREEVRRHLRLLIPIVVVALIGGFAGAWTLLHNSQQSFLRLVPYLFLLGSTAFALSGPIKRFIQRRTEQHGAGGERIHIIPLLAILSCLCFYIGYFGAGAGLLLMAAFALCGVERVAEINSLKVVTTTVANGVAVITFILHAAVAWRDCWYMMIACAIGGYTGARNSRRVSDRVLRPIIIIFGFTLAIYFFFHRNSF